MFHVILLGLASYWVWGALVALATALLWFLCAVVAALMGPKYPRASKKYWGMTGEELREAFKRDGI